MSGRHTGAVFRLPNTIELAIPVGDVWTGAEQVPYPCTDPRADSYRFRFLAKGFAAADRTALRLVTVRYADGVREVMLAARAGLDVDAVVRSLVSGDVTDIPATPETAAAPDALAVPWAFAERDAPRRLNRSRLTLPPGMRAPSAAVLATAVADAVGRRDRADSSGFRLRVGGATTGRTRPDETLIDVHEPPREIDGLTPVDRLSHAPDAALAFSAVDTAAGPASLVCDHWLHLVDDDTASSLLRDVLDVLVDEPVAVPAPQPPAALPDPRRIEQLVADRAAHRPSAVAVTFAGGQLTYGELAARAADLAGALQANGIRRGDRVGVSLPRGEHLVPAMLAVLMAGAAYVPLDPSYPVDRLRYLAEDSHVAAVIAEPGAAVFAAGPTLAPTAAAPHVPLAAAGPDDAAYVIYTSGSTGRPKGVVVEHRNVAALLAATRDEYALGEQDVWTLFHSYAFDFSVWEIWGCLATGGRLVVVPAETTRLPEDFRALLSAERVTVLNQTPSAFTQLLATEGPDASPLAVRLVIFGGEPLDSRVLLAWFDRHPERQCRVVNMFGITETTVHSSWRTLTRADALAGSRSVGTALPGWTLHVLDDRQRPVPAGGYGEIYVGGHGVARGYLDRPGLTADRFRPDHLSGVPGARLYRSGDLGRMARDGTIEHHGRLDRQVKVRGHRIELDEIHRVLLETAAVTAAAVVLNHRGQAADAHLDAYVVAGSATAEAIHRRLAEQLPAYMVPSTITLLDRLPLTANGKLDRAALPVPGSHSGQSARPAATPANGVQANGVQAKVVAAWEGVLGVPVSDEDNFFKIGGNSLLAIRVMARLRADGLAAASTARTLYENPTLRALSAALAH